MKQKFPQVMREVTMTSFHVTVFLNGIEYGAVSLNSLPQ